MKTVKGSIILILLFVFPLFVSAQNDSTLIDKSMLKIEMKKMDFINWAKSINQWDEKQWKNLRADSSWQKFSAYYNIVIYSKSRENWTNYSYRFKSGYCNYIRVEATSKNWVNFKDRLIGLPLISTNKKHREEISLYQDKDFKAFFNEYTYESHWGIEKERKLTILSSYNNSFELDSLHHYNPRTMTKVEIQQELEREARIDSLSKVKTPIKLPIQKQQTIEQTQPETRKYYTGAKGGCYYYSNSGKKVYVDRSYCK